MGDIIQSIEESTKKRAKEHAQTAFAMQRFLVHQRDHEKNIGMETAISEAVAAVERNAGLFAHHMLKAEQTTLKLEEETRRIRGLVDDDGRDDVAFEWEHIAAQKTSGPEHGQGPLRKLNYTPYVRGFGGHHTPAQLQAAVKFRSVSQRRLLGGLMNYEKFLAYIMLQYTFQGWKWFIMDRKFTISRFYGNTLVALLSMKRRYMLYALMVRWKIFTKWSAKEEQARTLVMRKLVDRDVKRMKKLGDGYAKAFQKLADKATHTRNEGFQECLKFLIPHACASLTGKNDAINPRQFATFFIEHVKRVRVQKQEKADWYLARGRLEPKHVLLELMSLAKRHVAATLNEEDERKFEETGPDIILAITKEVDERAEEEMLRDDYVDTAGEKMATQLFGQILRTTIDAMSRQMRQMAEETMKEHEAMLSATSRSEAVDTLEDEASQSAKLMASSGASSRLDPLTAGARAPSLNSTSAQQNPKLAKAKQLPSVPPLTKNEKKLIEDHVGVWIKDVATTDKVFYHLRVAMAKDLDKAAERLDKAKKDGEDPGKAESEYYSAENASQSIFLTEMRRLFEEVIDRAEEVLQKKYPAMHEVFKKPGARDTEALRTAQQEQNSGMVAVKKKNNIDEDEVGDALADMMEMGALFRKSPAETEANFIAQLTTAAHAVREHLIISLSYDLESLRRSEVHQEFLRKGPSADVHARQALSAAELRDKLLNFMPRDGDVGMVKEGIGNEELPPGIEPPVAYSTDLGTGDEPLDTEVLSRARFISMNFFQSMSPTANALIRQLIMETCRYIHGLWELVRNGAIPVEALAEISSTSAVALALRTRNLTAILEELAHIEDFFLRHFLTLHDVLPGQSGQARVAALYVSTSAADILRADIDNDRRQIHPVSAPSLGGKIIVMNRALSYFIRRVEEQDERKLPQLSEITDRTNKLFPKQPDLAEILTHLEAHEVQTMTRMILDVWTDVVDEGVAEKVRDLLPPPESFTRDVKDMHDLNLSPKQEIALSVLVFGKESRRLRVERYVRELRAKVRLLGILHPNREASGAAKKTVGGGAAAKKAPAGAMTAEEKDMHLLSDVDPTWFLMQVLELAKKDLTEQNFFEYEIPGIGVPAPAPPIEETVAPPRDADQDPDSLGSLFTGGGEGAAENSSIDPSKPRVLAPAAPLSMFQHLPAATQKLLKQSILGVLTGALVSKMQSQEPVIPDYSAAHVCQVLFDDVEDEEEVMTGVEESAQHKTEGKALLDRAVAGLSEPVTRGKPDTEQPLRFKKTLEGVYYDAYLAQLFDSYTVTAYCVHPAVRPPTVTQISHALSVAHNEHVRYHWVGERAVFVSRPGKLRTVEEVGHVLTEFLSYWAGRPSCSIATIFESFHKCVWELHTENKDLGSIPPFKLCLQAVEISMGLMKDRFKYYSKDLCVHFYSLVISLFAADVQLATDPRLKFIATHAPLIRVLAFSFIKSVVEGGGEHKAWFTNLCKNVPEFRGVQDLVPLLNLLTRCMSEADANVWCERLRKLHNTTCAALKQQAALAARKKDLEEKAKANKKKDSVTGRGSQLLRSMRSQLMENWKARQSSRMSSRDGEVRSSTMSSSYELAQESKRAANIHTATRAVKKMQQLQAQEGAAKRAPQMNAPGNAGAGLVAVSSGSETDGEQANMQDSARFERCERLYVPVLANYVYFARGRKLLAAKAAAAGRKGGRSSLVLGYDDQRAHKNEHYVEGVGYRPVDNMQAKDGSVFDVDAHNETGGDRFHIENLINSGPSILITRILARLPAPGLNCVAAAEGLIHFFRTTYRVVRNDALNHDAILPGVSPLPGEALECIYELAANVNLEPILQLGANTFELLSAFLARVYGKLLVANPDWRRNFPRMFDYLHVFGFALIEYNWKGEEILGREASLKEDEMRFASALRERGTGRLDRIDSIEELVLNSEDFAQVMILSASGFLNKAAQLEFDDERSVTDFEMFVTAELSDIALSFCWQGEYADLFVAFVAMAVGRRIIFENRQHYNTLFIHFFNLFTKEYLSKVPDHAGILPWLKDQVKRIFTICQRPTMETRMALGEDDADDGADSELPYSSSRNMENEDEEPKDRLGFPLPQKEEPEKKTKLPFMKLNVAPEGGQATEAPVVAAADPDANLARLEYSKNFTRGDAGNR
ncbi:unnamed protein product [Amoebophrya sp. A25]|nr:unnamed protein product [Amoebophrya sp. A25]|eukprot:GSA25T00016619001.1